MQERTLFVLSFALLIYSVHSACSTPNSSYNQCLKQSILLGNYTAVTSTTPTLITSVNRTGYIIFNSLVPGASYSFTNCISGSGVNHHTFPVVLILTDPDNNILVSAADCSDCYPGSATVSYLHSSSATFTYIKLHLYAYSSTNPVCSSQYAERLTDIYMVSTSTSCNSYSISCLYPSQISPVSLNSTGEITITPSILENTAYTNPCGLSLYTNVSTFTCKNVGVNPVELYFYNRAYTCNTTVNVVDSSAPTGTCTSGNFLVERTSCSENYVEQCTTVMSDMYFNSSFHFADNCESYYRLTYNYQYSNANPEVGTPVVVTGTAKDHSGNSYSATCTMTPFGWRSLNISNDFGFEQEIEYHIEIASYIPGGLSQVVFFLLPLNSQYNPDNIHNATSTQRASIFNNLISNSPTYPTFTILSGTSTYGVYSVYRLRLPLSNFHIGQYYFVGFFLDNSGNYILPYTYPLVQYFGIA